MRKNITVLWIAGIEAKGDREISSARGFRKSSMTNTSQTDGTE